LKDYCSPRIEPPGPLPQNLKVEELFILLTLATILTICEKKQTPCVMALPHHLATSNQQQLKQEIMFPEVPQKRREMFYEKFPQKMNSHNFLKISNTW
jgi:UV DNA damage repair endonuclease